jgi:hypothetical protein
MPGGLMQLVARGQQDIYLTGSPTLSYFQFVYRKHTNFAMESVHQTFLSKPVLDKSSHTIATCRIGRIADLLYDVFFSFQLPAIYSDGNLRFKWIDKVANYMVYTASVRVDTNIIDIQYGEWLDIWNELTLTTSKRTAYDKMTGNTYEFTNPTALNNRIVIENNWLDYQYYPAYTVVNGVATPSIPSKRFFMPLNFWFTKNPGLALPLVALQYQNIEISIEFRSIEELYQVYDTASGLYYSPSKYRALYPTADVSIGRFLVPGGGGPNALIDIDAYLECNYIFLDDEERRQVAANSTDYLVERVYRMETSGFTTVGVMDLIMQNPIKEVIWILRRNDVNDYNEWSNFTYNMPSDASQPTQIILKTAKILWNGLDRFEEKPYEYFNQVQPYQYHTNSPRDGIQVYSFSIFPEKNQPSGAFNATMISKIQLYLTMNAPTDPTIQYQVVSYATYYNIFRVMSGKGAMLFVN